MPAFPQQKRPIDRLGDAIAEAQSSDPFAPVTVIVPSPYARVQLRRAIGEERGLCNVAFRTWGELIGDLGRAAGGPGLKVPNRRLVDETIRSVLRSDRSPFESLARSPMARAQLMRLFNDLWRGGEGLRAAVAGASAMARSLVDVLAAVESHLADRGFTDPGRLLELAARAPVEASMGMVVRWFPAPVRTRDQAVIDRLVTAGVALSTIEDDGGAVSRLIACPDPDAEARIVTRRVLASVLEGVPLWRQAIVHPPSPRYARLVHQHLAAAGVPTSGPSPMPLTESATGRALLGMLALAAGEWRRSDVVRWLSSAPVTNGLDPLRAPVNRWDDISARAGVVEGFGQWLARLMRFAEIGSQRDPYVAHSESEASAARSLLEFMARLAEDLDLPSGPWSAWTDWCASILRRYLERPDGWPVAERIAYEQVFRALDDLRDLDLVGSDPDLVTFGGAVETELAARTVHDDDDVAKPGSEGEAAMPSTESRGLPGPVGSGVFVGSPADALGLVFSRVHVVGAADEFFPGLAPPASLLEADTEHPDWPTRERHADELLGELRSVIALGDEATTVTRPVVDPRTGRELVRSRWFDPGGRLGGWAEESVPSFSADVASDEAARIPLSGSERLLGALVRARMANIPLLEHAAVTSSEPGPAERRAPPLRVSLDAASAPSTTPFSRFEGNVGAALARDVSGELYPTRLEQYATCPRKYLLDRELHLDPPFRPEATEQMEARDRGTLVHEILATYIEERVQAPAPASLDRLLDIAERAFAIADGEGRCGPRLMAIVERENLLRDLRRFFEEDILDPQAAELAFGALASTEDVPEDRRDGSPSLPPPARSGAVEVELTDGRTVRFGGSVDRIDRAPDGTVVVSDYKTGRQRDLDQLRWDPVVGGKKLQLPIYALAAKAFMEWDGLVRARYWNLSWDRYQPSYACTLDDRLLDRFKDAVSTIASGIEAGVFPAYPGEEEYRGGRPTFANCAYCDFDRVCPTDRDRRWALAAEAPAVAPVLRLAEDPDPSLAGIVAAEPLEHGAGAP